MQVYFPPIVQSQLYTYMHIEAREYFSSPFEGSKLSAGPIGTAFFQALWAYDGFNNLNYAAEEMINPDKY